MADWGCSDWTSPSFSASAAVELSECRDLVEVPGGTEWRIRRLTDSCPQFCWKYSGTSSIVQYHFDIANNRQNEQIILDASAGDRPQLPVFYATLPFFTSPFEISVQPKYLDKVRANVTKQLNDVYSKSPPSFEKDQLFETISCACPVLGEWYRGRVTRLCGNDVATVELVDFGTEKILPRSELRPLFVRFGRVPPMALRCRVKDVYVNDLDTRKVTEFKDLIERCGNLVRAELWNTVEPYFVNLYHPTIDGYNLGKVFYKPEEDVQRELAKQRKWHEHCQRQACEDDYDFDNDEEDEDECYDEEEWVEPPLQYIRSFDRTGKVIRAGDDPLLVGHVENTRLIYLHTEWMLEQRSQIEKQIEQQWNDLPEMPASWRQSGVACAVNCEGQYRRATIDSIGEIEEVSLLFIDYGSFAVVDSSCSLRVLPEDDLFVAHPMVYVVGLDGCSEYFPHPSETNLLRQIVPEGSRVRFRPDTKHKRVPMRGVLITEEGLVDVREELNDLLCSHRVDVLCSSLVPFSPRTVPSHSTQNKGFSHRIVCPTPLLKGNLEVSTLFP